MNAPTGPRLVRSRRAVLAGALFSIALLGAACSGSGTHGATGGVTEVKPTPAAVVIDTFMFMPKTVHVHVGDTVTWTNHDDILHTVTSGTRNYDPGDSGRVTATNKDGVFDMQLDGKNATGSYTFRKAGTYHYFCDRHPGMEGDVVVS